MTSPEVNPGRIVRCVWYGSGAPFDSALWASAVCSVLVSFVVFPVLETATSGLVTRQESSEVKTSKGARMIGELWTATKNVCWGLTGGLLIQTRRNDLS